MSEKSLEQQSPAELLSHKSNIPLNEKQLKELDCITEQIDGIEEKLNEKSETPKLPELDNQKVDDLKNLLNKIVNDPTAIENKIDKEYYENNIDFFSDFLANSSIITGIFDKISIAKYISALTNFGYNPTEGIRANMLFSMQDRLLYIHQLGKIFHTDFLGNIDINFTLHDIDKKLMSFIGNYEVKFSKMEHMLINNFFGKLIIALYSDFESAFVQPTHCITKEFISIISELDKNMRELAKSDKMILKSWSSFANKLLDTRTEFRFKSFTDLSEKLKICYENKFPIEILLADCLKTFIPTISLDYINVVKEFYIMIRLFAIYLDKFIDKAENPFADIIVIAKSVCVDYEATYFGAAMIPRSLPKCEKSISEEFKLYYISHTLTGPQYYILKQLEYSLPSFWKKYLLAKQ